MAALPSEIVEEMIQIPKSYFCRITKQIAIDPVSADDGYTYEREAIEEWLETNDTSPKTDAKVQDKPLKSNRLQEYNQPGYPFGSFPKFESQYELRQAQPERLSRLSRGLVRIVRWAWPVVARCSGGM